MRESARDDGQAAVSLVTIAAALFVALIVAIGQFGGHALDRTRAQTAADAAALGSLDGGRSAARQLAAAHGADLVSWERGPGSSEVMVVVTVVVRIGDSSATARATNGP